MKRIAILDTKIEYHRFTSKIYNCKIFITHQNPLSFLKLYFLELNKYEIIFVASRVPDIFLLKILKNRAKKIVVLQHAFTENNQFFNFNYIKNNSLKFFLWSCSIIFMIPLFFKKFCLTNLNCFYFTDYYKNRIKEIYKNSNYFKCSDPNPLIYGSPYEIKISDQACDFFYVDEPLSKTLGISKLKEQYLIKELINKYKIKKLYVKIHPRSKHKKFKTFKNVFVVDHIFSKTTNLIGYKSNLLRYNYDSKFLIALNSDTLKWEKKIFYNKFKVGYITDVKKYLKNIK